MKMKFVLIIVCCFSLFSCSKNEEVPQAENRKCFNSSAEFVNTLKDLSSLNTEELKEWSSTQGYKSYLTKNDTTLSDYPEAFLTILNDSSEYQIADTIVWFNAGKLYFIPKGDKSSLLKIKSNPETCKLTGLAFVKTINQSELKTFPLDINEAQSHQKQFNYGGQRKYIHEWYSFYTATNPGPVFYIQLHFRLKLEYKGGSSGNWKAAGEKRISNINVSGNITCPFYSTNYSIPNRSWSSYSGPLDFFLADLRGGIPYGNDFWKVTMSGSIYHKIVGDVESNAYNESGNIW